MLSPPVCNGYRKAAMLCGETLFERNVMSASTRLVKSSNRDFISFALRLKKNASSGRAITHIFLKASRL